MLTDLIFCHCAVASAESSFMSANSLSYRQKSLKHSQSFYSLMFIGGILSASHSLKPEWRATTPPVRL